MKTPLSIVFLLVLVITTPTALTARSFQEDIFYQIFPIAFRDSDGDGIGDFNGIVEAIPYLQSLGVTAVWLNPVFLSKTYHGYQYARNDSLNPRFGTEAEFAGMVEALHDAGIEVFIDLVAYGVGEEHPFFQDARGNPASAYDQWFAFTDEGNWNYFGFGGGYHDWEGNWITHVFWDHNHQPVREHLIEKLSHWLDPNEDGDFHDGIDGFRVDHLSVGWWSESQWGYDLPLWDDLTAGLRGANPEVRFIAEDSDWGTHHPDMFKHGIDAAFDIPMMNYLLFYLYYELGWELSRAAAEELEMIAQDGQWLRLLNNHDVARARTLFEDNLGDSEEYSRLAAVWLFTGPFPPVMYYGEEIGMRGKKVDWYGTDANDLHVREPFEWNAVLTSPPHAYWFGDHPEYTVNQYIQDGDGISVQEQEADSTSLLNYYRRLSALRKGHAVLQSGEYFPVWVGDSRVFSCLRHDQTSSVLVAMNFTDESLDLSLDVAGTPLGLLERTATDLWNDQAYPDITPANADDYPVHIDALSPVILGISGPVDTTEHNIVFQVDLSSWEPSPELFPPQVRGNKYPLSWYYGCPMADMGNGLWRAEVLCKGSLHGQTVEYKYKLSGRGFDEYHSIGWSPDPNLTFVVDTTQHPQTLQDNGANWPQPYQEHPVRFVIDLSHWEQQPFAHDLELRGDLEPLSWYQGIDMEYQGEGIWSKTVTMTLAQNTWFFYKYKLNGPQFSDHSSGWSPDPNNFVWIDTTISPFVVEYDGTIWHQPYETSVEPDDDESALPQKFQLYQNYPNPFNAKTTIQYYLPEKSHVEIRIYNVSGQLVETLVSEQKNRGNHYAVWDAKDLSSGIYFCQITAGEYQEIRKCVLLK